MCSLIRSLEFQHIPASITDLPNAAAIVVLGGGIHAQIHPRQFPEVMDGGDRPLYAALLYQAGKAPLVIPSGGRIPWWGDDYPSEATDMTYWLTRLGVPARAIEEEGASLNTYQNAIFTKEILDRRGITRIILVTSAYHMPRSKRIFEKLGLTVVPAATDFSIVSPLDESGQEPPGLAATILSLIPDANALAQTSLAMKEYVGLWIYQLRGWA